MPWPDFTELSFGYCFLRELETKYTRDGRFPKAPDFISQHAEKTDGYDVEVAMTGSIPLFIQLKRSMIIKSPNAVEYTSPHFPHRPVFRMNLHRKDSFAQHEALQRLESHGNHVIYATSQIRDPQDLLTHTKNGTMVSDASTIFSPASINLPTWHEPHHVSFYANQSWAVLFSREGEWFERTWPKSLAFIDEILSSPNSREDNEKAMLNAERTLLGEASKTELNMPRRLLGILDGLDGPSARVSVLAHYLLDTQLMFLKPPVGDE